MRAPTTLHSLDLMCKTMQSHTCLDQKTHVQVHKSWFQIKKHFETNF